MPRLGYLYGALGVFYSMKSVPKAPNDSEALEIIATLEKSFTEAMDDDFNTPLALTNLVIALNRMRAFAAANESIGEAVEAKAVDKVIELEAGQRIVAVKDVTLEEDFLKGHFPNRPIMPGTSIVEAMAQTAILLYYTAHEDVLKGMMPTKFIQCL